MLVPSFIGKIGLLFAVFFCVACGRPFDVNVGTDEPIQVDVNMDVHVYQHGESSPEDKAKREEYNTVMERHRNRMAEIRKLKDNRLVGEDYQGLLSIRNLPAGEYGLYVKKTVDEENKDRNFLMKVEAEKKGVAIGEIRLNQWRHWQRKSFLGEWIQIEGDEPETYRWEQKTGAGGEGEKSGDGEKPEDATKGIGKQDEKQNQGKITSE